MTAAVVMFIVSAALYVAGTVVREIQVGPDGVLGRRWLAHTITLLLVLSTFATVVLTFARLTLMAVN
ncbi:MAG: hypothetical protein QM809_13260 [Gordonia sp. (in: high G+C Gram-positive bacteria)]|uniref:hypothetical protein n=1 Tax=Gordonia sp. (in: high G+C Gram-positive bacteria) TaxID=84139 RepID=UPI0039E2ADF7